MTTNRHQKPVEPTKGPQTMDDTRPTPNVALRPTPSAAIMPPIGCGRCDNRWGGVNTCHCGGCHRTFSGLTAFDKHRTGSFVKGTRACLDPADAGLALNGRDYECWGLPGDGSNPWSV